MSDHQHSQAEREQLSQQLREARDMADVHRSSAGQNSLQQQLEDFARQDGTQALHLWKEHASPELQQQPGAMPQALRMIALVEARFEDSRRREMQVAGDRDVYVRRAEPGGTYDGPIIGTTDRHVLQRLKDSEDVILHRRRSLDMDPRAHGSQEVQIRYPHGRVGLVDLQKADSTLERDRMYQHQHQREAGR